MKEVARDRTTVSTPATHRAMRPLRALIVDDSDDDTLLILHALKSQGYNPLYRRVDTPGAMEDALDRQPWDVVLADYRVAPHFSGPSALSLLQQKGIDLPFIIVSGAISEDVAVECMKRGAHDYLTKDNLTLLTPVIEREMRESHIRRARSKAEVALRDTHERFRATFHQAAVGMAHAGLDGRFQLVNAKLCDYLGYDEAELLGAPFQDISHPDETAIDQENLSRLLSGAATTFSREKRYIRKDSVVVWANLTVSLVRDSWDRPKYFISVIEDITHRKRAEAALREVRKDERRRVARDLHDEVLQDLVDTLQTLRIKQLRSSKYGSEFEVDDEVAALASAIKGLRGAIYDLRLSGEHRESLLDDLDALIDLNQKLSPGVQIELVVEGTPLVSLDAPARVELRRLVQEALVNVRRHSEASHVQIVVGSDEHEFWAEIRDDGRGFVLGSAGRGVGLIGMRERARALGGELHIESDRDAGTCLRFRAPLGMQSQAVTNVELFNKRPDVAV